MKRRPSSWAILDKSRIITAIMRWLWWLAEYVQQDLFQAHCGKTYILGGKYVLFDLQFAGFLDKMLAIYHFVLLVCGRPEIWEFTTQRQMLVNIIHYSQSVLWVLSGSGFISNWWQSWYHGFLNVTIGGILFFPPATSLYPLLSHCQQSSHLGTAKFFKIEA